MAAKPSDVAAKLAAKPSDVAAKLAAKPSDVGGLLAAAKVSVHATRKQRTEAKPNGPWSAEEDEALRNAVDCCGAKGKSIAERMNLLGFQRTGTQCLNRWRKVLQPGLVKGTWTDDEDAAVRDMVLKHGVGKIKWSDIAATLPGRMGKQCRERWFNHLDPTIRKGEWTPEEDRIIFEVQQRVGNRWRDIARLLPGRTENSVKNRWNSAARRKWFQEHFGTDGPPEKRPKLTAGAANLAAAALPAPVPPVLPAPLPAPLPAQLPQPAPEPQPQPVPQPELPAPEPQPQPVPQPQPELPAPQPPQLPPPQPPQLPPPQPPQLPPQPPQQPPQLPPPQPPQLPPPQLPCGGTNLRKRKTAMQPKPEPQPPQPRPPSCGIFFPAPMRPRARDDNLCLPNAGDLLVESLALLDARGRGGENMYSPSIFGPFSSPDTTHPIMSEPLSSSVLTPALRNAILATCLEYYCH